MPQNKQQVLNRVGELVPELDCCCYEFSCICDSDAYAHHLLEAVRRADSKIDWLEQSFVTIDSMGSLAIQQGESSTIIFTIPLLSPIEDWDQDMKTEEAMRMWELLAKALGIES